MKAYIYQIKNEENGKLYIGSTISPDRRFYEHKYDLVRNVHHAEHLQNAWNKYGEQVFSFTIVEETEITLRYKREKFWILTERTLNPDYGYNTVVPDEKGGFYKTNEMKKKISQGVINSLIKQRGRVILLNLETGEESFFDSLVEMKASTSTPSNKKLSLKNKTYWRYESENISTEKRLELLFKCESWYNADCQTEYTNIPKKVFAFDYTKECFHSEHCSIEQAARVLNVSSKLIRRILVGNIKSAKGYTFSYSSELPVFQKHRKDKKWVGKRIRKPSKSSVSKSSNKTFKYSITNGEHFHLSYSVPELVKYVSGTTKKGWQKLASGERKSYMGYTLSRLQ